jgi:4-amino-4-deoxy-L-arabinose transferase-like glycosyltransferase
MNRYTTKFNLLIFMLLIALFRLITLNLYPLTDNTEARYAEIARKMLELNDWVTPWSDYAVPFWGKPPLSFWATALSFKLFGVNELAARLPHYLCGLLVIWLIWQWVAQRSRAQAFYAVVLLSGAFLFFTSSGMVMTDMWLLLGTTLSMRGFWAAVSAERNAEKWLLFVGLAVGLLAKGPVAVVLTGLPIFLWMVVCNKYSVVWKSIPWIYGSLLTAAIALPWYVIAELHTPGYLNYFLIGENFHRFVTPGWQGDLYGSAHNFPRGTIWLFMIADWLPWSFLFPALLLWLWRKGKITKSPATDRDWQRYLLIWGLTPAIFFSFAGNILWPYVLPGFPGLALWLSTWLNNQQAVDEQSRNKLFFVGLTFTCLITLLTMFSLPLLGVNDNKSAKSLVALYQSQQRSHDEQLVYYGKRPFSASFYSQGKAQQELDLATLDRRIASENIFVAIDSEKRSDFPAGALNHLQLVGERGKYQLFHAINKGPSQSSAQNVDLSYNR